MLAPTFARTLAIITVGLIGIATNVAVSAAAGSDGYLDQLRDEAGDVAAMPKSAEVVKFKQEEIVAARLGVTTPYGRKALEAELRSYYPGAYRSYRGLDSATSAQLWEVYEQTGSTVKVLEEMDVLLAQ